MLIIDVVVFDLICLLGRTCCTLQVSLVNLFFSIQSFLASIFFTEMLISQIGCSDNCDCSNISLRSGRARRRAVLKLQLRRVSPQAASLQARTDDAIGENETGAL